MKYVLAVLVFLSLTAPREASAQLTARCQVDDWIMYQVDAVGRNGWARRCNYIAPATEQAFNSANMYVIFSTGCANGCATHIPVREWEPCVSGLTMLGACMTGCYTPDQKLSFQGRYVGIEDAYASRQMSVSALSANSAQGRVSFSAQPIRNYVAGKTVEDIFVLKTKDGKRLEVTSKHPMVLGSGEMVKAHTLKAGDALLGADGKPVTLESVSTHPFEGMVWNVQPTSTVKQENVLDAEGLMTGSVRFQNEWANDQFRLSLRDELNVDAL